MGRRAADTPKPHLLELGLEVPGAFPVQVVQGVGRAPDASWFGSVLTCRGREVGLPEHGLALDALSGEINLSGAGGGGRVDAARKERPGRVRNARHGSG